MKGIVFTEFLDLVEDKFGLEVVDKIITKSELDSGGSYTAIGTYAFDEMLQLLTNLSIETDISTNDLLQVYGEHFFSVIERSYPQMLDRYTDPLDMLASVENHIHVEVRKIYPDAELPTFELIERTPTSLKMVYKSSRAMYMFGLGLMNSTFKYYKADSDIQISKLKEDGTEVQFDVSVIG
jgi:hypothetical protein